ncbi:hypothetical protein GCM10010269_19700 [Streptomyces humidus]|uniref:Uncharacterized protein n=1 Tax=Streptomyces humidus TaxID=52259 RepID=A0A918FTT4_9ACTN|nr:hypothetical protein [Streptomyces humidus]GGR80616.1 hypothetical protein GCM10010269_19700 [Streptomyces humidus]
MAFPSRHVLPPEPGEPAAPGSRITVEAGDILMRRGLNDHARSAHVNVIEAAKALEDFRLGRNAALERAEILARRAVTTFQERTGEHDEAAWQAVVVYMVELWASRYTAGRPAAFDPAPAPPSLFTPGHPLRLETVSRDAHDHVLGAGRSLERAARGVDTIDIARAQHGMHEAARLLHDQLDGLSMPLWVLISRFCAEIHAENLRILKTPAPGTSA